MGTNFLMGKMGKDMKKVNDKKLPYYLLK